MTHKTLATMTTLSLFMTLTACADDGDNAVITGTWQSEICEPFPTGDGGTTYKTRAYELADDGTYRAEIAIFGEDASCSQAALIIEVSGTYELRGASEHVEGADNIFFAYGDRVVLPTSEGSAAWLSSSAMCGRTDWVGGTAVNVHEAGCAGLNVPAVSECAGEHDLVLVQGGKLYLGGRTTNTLDNACREGNYPTFPIQDALVPATP